jgi:fatty-acyl-CoA synthase
MCALQMADGVQFVPDEFTAFLDAQPDLGTKWRPRFVRVVDHVPTTGSNKVAKTPLRREGWVSSDPVFWRLGTDTTYRPLDGRQRDAIAQEFADHGRTALLPASG